MSVFLADGNALIALVVADHVHHQVVSEWFESGDGRLATCPMTEGTLLRFLLRERHSLRDSIAVLESLRAQEWHEFWPDALAYDSSMLRGVIGHRQVTDAYLVALAQHFDGNIVTLDRGLAAMHGESVLLLQP